MLKGKDKQDIVKIIMDLYMLHVIEVNALYSRILERSVFLLTMFTFSLAECDFLAFVQEILSGTLVFQNLVYNLSTYNIFIYLCIPENIIYFLSQYARQELLHIPPQNILQNSYVDYI